MKDTLTAAVPAAAVTAAAERLLSAADSRHPCLPVRDLIGATDVEAAYAVQEVNIASRVGAGAHVIGRKIGLTSPAVQAQLGVDQPDFGVLLDVMGYPAGSVVSIGEFLQPRVEAEVAFVLGADLAVGELDYDQVSAAVEVAVAALEICDSRIAGWDISLGDTIADNASAGAFVLGSQRLTLDQVQPREVSLRMTVTGQEDSTGTGEDCLGDPLLALQWLARQARDLGEPLRAGQVILSGALGPMRVVSPGAHVHAVIEGLGEVSVSFSSVSSREEKA